MTDEKHDPFAPLTEAEMRELGFEDLAPDPNPMNEHQAGIERAADALLACGNAFGWFSDRTKGVRHYAIGNWRELDPIGKDEFLAIVECIVRSYLEPG